MLDYFKDTIWLLEASFKKAVSVLKHVVTERVVSSVVRVITRKYFPGFGCFLQQIRCPEIKIIF